MSSANAFNLDQGKILSFGKELKDEMGDDRLSFIEVDVFTV